MIHQHPVNYPCSQPDMFLIYLLGMCPKQTSICFGCRNSLKPGGVIGTPPADLVIVSKMVRTWTHEGQQQSRHANVYVHCVPTCVRTFNPATLLLLVLSSHFLEMNIGSTLIKHLATWLFVKKMTACNFLSQCIKDVLPL